MGQEAQGELKEVDGTQVVVMKGSYSYIGADGQTYTVDWYADETGYHPSAPHLPQSVEPDHPEVAAAVKAREASASSTPTPMLPHLSLPMVMLPLSLPTATRGWAPTSHHRNLISKLPVTKHVS